MKLIRQFVFVIFVFLLFSCGKETLSFSEDGSQYISLISQSSLNRDSKITIMLTGDISNEKDIAKAASFSSEQKGHWELVAPNTIAFQADGLFKEGEEFSLSLDVGRLLNKGSGKIGITRTFQVRPAQFDMSIEALRALDAETYIVEGKVQTDIACNSDMIASAVSAMLDATAYEVRFAKNEATTTHRFTIDAVKRGKRNQVLRISYDAKNIGFKLSGSLTREIPAIGSFEIINVQDISDRALRFTFSENLNPSIDLSEYIKVLAHDTNFSYRWDFERNNLTLTCSRDAWPSGTVVSIYPNFESADGHVLQKGIDYTVIAGWEKPSLKFMDNNVILPSDGKAIVAIETKNVKGVIVQAVKVQNSNILQFLQVNELDESNEMYRVGEAVWEKAFDFEWKPEMKNKFVARGLDMTELVKKYPDGMFQIRLTFARRHSMYESLSATANEELEFPADFVNFAEYPLRAYWNSVKNADERSRYKFWEHDEDPLHPAFYIYNYNRAVLQEKNILVSNLALLAKVDSSDTVYIQAINILTSQAEKNTKIKIYNFTQSLIEEGSCDDEGRYKVKAKAGDFTFVQAKSGNNYAYLSLNTKPLSTSNFKVDGVKSYEGLKGFIYAERGVWRPGDKLHLCLIVQDLKKALPENVPLIFTLQDPMGKIIDKKVLNESVGGFYKVETQTNASDLSGTWTGRFKIGNNVWTKALKIESIIANKLAVNLKVEGDYFTSGLNKVSLSSEWLTGIKAKGLKAEIYSRYVSKPMYFDNFRDYTFTDSQYYTSTSQEKIWSGNLDENGIANFNLKLDAGKNISGMLHAIFETRVYEPSGAYSIETKKMDYSPFPRYVGLKLPKSDDEYRDVLYLNKDHKAELVLVDEKGKLLSVDEKLEFTIYKLEWLWWWVRDAYTKASYDEKRSARAVLRKTITLKNGRAQVDFTLNDWGRYLFVVSDPEGKHSASKIEYVDYSYWASRSDSDVEGSSSMLLLTSNKDSYNINEDAKLSFTANKNSTAYITIEKNGAIVKQEIVKTVDGTNTYTFKTDSSMAPNVYVHVTLVQEYAQNSNSLGLRLYGIIPIMVEDKNSHLTPVIKTANEFAPNTDCKVTISEKNGRDATFTLALVDEGLLGLTAFKTANPWNYFYGKESSQIKSYDVFDLVSAAINGELQTLITVGGSDYNELISNKEAERFKPLVFYFGPFHLKKGESKTLDFKMPEYIGKIRLMAVMANDTAYGITEESVTVKSDVMLSPSLARTLGVDETMQIPVTVFNTTEKSKNISIIMQAKGAISTKETLNVKIDALSNKTISFSVESKNAGTSEITFIAKEGLRELSRSTTEIAIQSRGTNYENEKIIALKAGQSLNEIISTEGENGSKSLNIEISKVQAIGVEKHLDYLLSFPHFCFEQITSKAFAQLYLDRMLNLDKESLTNIKENIKTVIERYPMYQLSNAGFSYWPGGTYEYIWASAYALHFLTEAKRAGYYVDASVYNSLVKHLKLYANAFSSKNIYDLNSQAYRLYALSLIGEANMGAMNRLRKEKDLSQYAKALLSLAYASSGNEAQARQVFAEIATDFPSYRKTGDDFSSSIRDLAITCLAAKKLNDSRADARFTNLRKIANEQTWLSTQEAAWLLITASNFYSKKETGTVEYELQVAGQKFKNTLEAQSQVYTIKLNDDEKQKIEIKNTGNTNMFVSLRYKSKISCGKESAKSNGISLKQKIFKNKLETSLHTIKHGDSFKVDFIVNNTSLTNLDNLVLSFPIPSGWEISNERLAEESQNSDYSYLDIRDEIIYVHFDLAKNETKTFSFNATATYGGEYFVPAVTCEAMYDAEIRANTLGLKIKAMRY